MAKTKATTKRASKKAPVAEDSKNPLLVSRPKNFAIGNDLPPKRDVTRFIRWPKYIIRQRQRRVLERRLKVPSSLNQFRLTLEKGSKAELFKFLGKYKPETAKEKKERLTKHAEEKKNNPKAKLPAKKTAVHFGIQEVTRMVEEKKAKLVVIAHDVDPIEIVVWMPALCKAQEIPYCIVKGKAALGKIAGMKTCTCLAVGNVDSQDSGKLKGLIDTVNSGFLARYEEVRKQWGGLIMGRKGRSTGGK